MGRTGMALLGLVLALQAAEAADNGLGKQGIMGWNTWCTSGACGQPGKALLGPKGDEVGKSLHDWCSEAEILSVAQAMLKNGMYRAGYDYITLDDCWSATSRTASGELHGDATRFPEGMDSFIKKLHALGFKVGLYISGGIYTCSSGGRPGHVPGSYGHYTQDAETLTGWGVDYIKMDWCDWHWNSTVLLPWKVTNTMHKALNATGRPVWFMFHCLIYPEDTQYCGTDGNSFRIFEDHHDNWASTTGILEWVAGVGKVPSYVGPTAWPDMDFLMTGGAGCNEPTPGKRCPGQTDEEYKTEFAMWALASGSLLVASDVRNMSSLQKDILLNSELLQVFKDTKGYMAHVDAVWLCDADPGRCTVWGKPLANGDIAVAMLNLDHKAHTITTEFHKLAEVGWNGETKVEVRDLWAHSSLGTHKGKFSATVPAHGTGVYYLKKAD